MNVPAINIKTIIHEELNFVREQKPDNLMPYQSDYGLSGDYTADDLVKNARKQMDGIHDLADFVVNHPHEIIHAAQMVAIFIPGGPGYLAYGLLGLLDAAVYVFDDKDFYMAGIAVIETVAMLAGMAVIDKFLPMVLRIGKESWKIVLKYFNRIKRGEKVTKESLNVLTKESERKAVEYIIRNPKVVQQAFTKATLETAAIETKKFFSKSFSKLITGFRSSKAALAIFYVQYALKKGLMTVAQVMKTLGKLALDIGVLFSTQQVVSEDLQEQWIKVYYALGINDMDFDATMESREMILEFIEAKNEAGVTDRIDNMSVREKEEELERLMNIKTKIPAYSQKKLNNLPKFKQIDVKLVTANAGNIQQFLIDKGFKIKKDWSFGNSTAEAFGNYYFNGVVKHNGQPVQGKQSFKLLFDKFKSAGLPIGDKVGPGVKFITTIANLINKKEISKK